MILTPCPYDPINDEEQAKTATAVGTVTLKKRSATTQTDFNKQRLSLALPEHDFFVGDTFTIDAYVQRIPCFESCALCLVWVKYIDLVSLWYVQPRDS